MQCRNVWGLFFYAAVKGLTTSRFSSTCCVGPLDRGFAGAWVYVGQRTRGGTPTARILPITSLLMVTCGMNPETPGGVKDKVWFYRGARCRGDRSPKLCTAAVPQASPYIPTAERIWEQSAPVPRPFPTHSTLPVGMSWACSLPSWGSGRAAPWLK